MGFALTPGEAPLHFSRSKNVMHVALAEEMVDGISVVHEVVLGSDTLRTR